MSSIRGPSVLRVYWSAAPHVGCPLSLSPSRTRDRTPFSLSPLPSFVSPHKIEPWQLLHRCDGGSGRPHAGAEAASRGCGCGRVGPGQPHVRAGAGQGGGDLLQARRRRRLAREASRWGRVGLGQRWPRAGQRRRASGGDRRWVGDTVVAAQQASRLRGSSSRRVARRQRHGRRRCCAVAAASGHRGCVVAARWRWHHRAIRVFF